MLDTTLDILESDPNYHSFTMDGHSIMIDDYLEMRPERRGQVEKFLREGRLIIGPYYTLPYARDVIAPLDIELPDALGKGFEIDGVKIQPLMSEKSSIFVDSIWEVPTILESTHHRVYARLENIPALGYRTYEMKGSPNKMQKREGIANGNVLENDRLRATVNPNGTLDVAYKETGMEYRGLNFYTSQGEVGNAWKHEAPDFDRKYSTIGTQHKIYVTESGELSDSIAASVNLRRRRAARRIRAIYIQKFR